MSTKWNYVRHIGRIPRKMKVKKEKLTGENEEIMKFTNMTSELKGAVGVGRSWKASELRLKSNEDLHKLWYVKLKEKNKLLSDRLMCIQQGLDHRAHQNIVKVKVSMKRLMTVVGERKTLLFSYRKMLEDEYIFNQ